MTATRRPHQDDMHDDITTSSRRRDDDMRTTWQKHGDDTATMPVATTSPSQSAATLPSHRRRIAVVAFVAMLLSLRLHVLTMSWLCGRHVVVLVWLLQCLEFEVLTNLAFRH